MSRGSHALVLARWLTDWDQHHFKPFCQCSWHQHAPLWQLCWGASACEYIDARAIEVIRDFYIEDCYLQTFISGYVPIGIEHTHECIFWLEKPSAQHISCTLRCFIPDPKSFPVPFSVQALPHVKKIHSALRIRQAQIEQSRSHHLLLTGALKGNKVPDTQYADPRWQLPGQKLRAMRYIGLAWLPPSFRSSATKDTAPFSHARNIFACVLPALLI